MRYVHLNPVKIKMLATRTIRQKIEYLRKYRWSSYCGYAGLEGRKLFVDYGPLDALFGGGRRKKVEIYREMVESGVAKTDEELKGVLEISSKAIGEKEFCRQIEESGQFRRSLAAARGSRLGL
jgi:hypothetical protein